VKGIIKLTTPKGEKVLINFDNVIYCHKTHNNNTSVKFNYTIGEQNKAAYLVVVEDFNSILQLLS